MSKVKKSTRPVFPKCTWDQKYDLAHINFYGSEILKLLHSHSIEVRVKGLGLLIIDIGINNEILGIESLYATRHFPKWVLEQARKE